MHFKVFVMKLLLKKYSNWLRIFGWIWMLHSDAFVLWIQKYSFFFIEMLWILHAWFIHIHITSNSCMRYSECVHWAFAQFQYLWNLFWVTMSSNARIEMKAHKIIFWWTFYLYGFICIRFIDFIDRKMCCYLFLFTFIIIEAFLLRESQTIASEPVCFARKKGEQTEFVDLICIIWSLVAF